MHVCEIHRANKYQLVVGCRVSRMKQIYITANTRKYHIHFISPANKIYFCRL